MIEVERVLDAGAGALGSPYLSPFEKKTSELYALLGLDLFAYPAILRPSLDRVYLFPLHMWNMAKLDLGGILDSLCDEGMIPFSLLKDPILKGWAEKLDGGALIKTKAGYTFNPEKIAQAEEDFARVCMEAAFLAQLCVTPSYIEKRYRVGLLTSRNVPPALMNVWRDLEKAKA
ncbi:MAG: hypothetical protein IKS61_02210 [Aeriscardovia sp.]|nr:hypothetical protein [Aeriscardovia sp.]